MEREETLRLMKENGSKGKEYERVTLLRGDNMAVGIALLLGIAFMLIKLHVRQEFDYGICAVVFLASCIQSINEGIKLSKWWLVIAGVFNGLITLVMIFMFLGEVFIQ